MLKNGWLDGLGLAPSLGGLQWFAESFESQFPSRLPLPYLYPTPTGGVQLEWSIKGREISLEIDLNTGRGEWHALNLETDEAEESVLDLRPNDGWDSVIARLTTLIGTTSND
jgi:hypothetical protein